MEGAGTVGQGGKLFWGGAAVESQLRGGTGRDGNNPILARRELFTVLASNPGEWQVEARNDQQARFSVRISKANEGTGRN